MGYVRLQQLTLAVVLICLVAPQSVQEFGDWIEEFFENSTKFSHVDEAFNKVKENIEDIPAHDPIAVLRASTAGLNKLVNDRVAALQRLAQGAENVTQVYFDNAAEVNHVFSETRNVCNQNYGGANLTLYNAFNKSIDSERINVHVTIDSYACEKPVLRDFAWTTNRVIENVMVENEKRSPEIGRQYIGTYSGLTLMYTKNPWVLNQPQITTDLFDPRYRPWFIAAETVPKDILFLIDMSGSVTGPTCHLIRSTLKFIFSLLTPNDYFYALQFASSFEPILKTGHNFLPATTSNKKTFDDELHKIEPTNQAMFSAPLNISLDILRNEAARNATFDNHRSGGHKLLVIFTDGVDDWPTDVLDKEFANQNKDLIRIFGYSMGYGTNELPLQKYMACKSRGRYSEVDSIQDVKMHSRMIMNKLSEVRGKTLRGTDALTRQPSWTQLYMDAQAGGPTITLSLPILNKPNRDVWKEQKLAGVAAIDVHISEITRHLPLNSDHLYTFVVDNNGIIIYHPKLKLPKTEAHCVRRSACYDSQTTRHRSSLIQRVQHGMSDERVYRLVGLIDSISTLDMFDLEGNSTAMIDLRTKIIQKKCDIDGPIHSSSPNRKTYNCAHIQQSPFTLVVVNTTMSEDMKYTDDINIDLPFDNKLITFFYNRRSDCDWQLDTNKTERFKSFLNSTICPNSQLDQALVKGIEKWAEHIPHNSTHELHCLEVPYIMENLDFRQFFVNSFVHLRSTATASYPFCADSYMASVAKKFDDEIHDPTTNNNNNDINFSIITKREKKDGKDLETQQLIMYRIISYRQKRLAVIGTQWKDNFFQNFLDKFIGNRKDWDNYRNSRYTYSMLTRDGYVIATNIRKNIDPLPVHISKYDPQIALYLVEWKFMNITTQIDAQSECTPLKTTAYSSASPGSTSFLKYLVTTIFKFLKIAVWKNMYESIILWANGQVEYRNGECTFQKIVPFEKCSEKQNRYFLEPRFDEQLSTPSNQHPQRFVKFVKIPKTSLILMITDSPAPDFTFQMGDDQKLNEIWQQLQMGAMPIRLTSDEMITSYQRRKPDVLNDWKAENQSDVQCDTSLTMTTKFRPFLLTFFTFFSWTFIGFVF